MENVLFFPTLIASPHFETDIELILNELKSGNNIYIILCDNCFKYCLNKNVNITCGKCKKTMKQTLKYFKTNKNIFTINLKEYFEDKSNIHFPDDINNIDNLKKLKTGSFDTGYAVASLFAIELDTCSFDKCKNEIAVAYSDLINFYSIIKSIIQKYAITKGYIFNASYYSSRALFQVFIDNNIDIYNHDRGSTMYKYEIFKNALIHDIDDFYLRVNKVWDGEPDITKKKEIADNFYKKRLGGEESNYISFTNKQNINKLPQNINNYKKIIVIFNSSQYEYEYISDRYSYKFYDSQIDGIEKIVDSLKNYPDIGIFLREHPNQKDKINRQRDEVKKIKSDNFHLIPAESDISSYALLLKADIVITFNSTMGIEASYWGIPSILCSNAIYENLNIAYQPNSHNEVINLILSDLKPIKSDDIYKYGYYNSVHGIEFTYYKPISFFEGTFMGKNLFTFQKSIKLRIFHFVTKKFPKTYSYYKMLKYFFIKKEKL